MSWYSIKRENQDNARKCSACGKSMTKHYSSEGTSKGSINSKAKWICGTCNKMEDTDDSKDQQEGV